MGKRRASGGKLVDALRAKLGMTPLCGEFALA